jgi:hypothetical protein
MTDNTQALKARWPSLRDPLDEAAVEEDNLRSVVADPLADDPLADDVSTPNASGASGQAAEPTVMVMAEAPPPLLTVADAQRALTESHVRMAQATDAQRAARGNMALALEKFQRATMQTCTAEQLVRQHLESENQLRADRAAGKIPPHGGQRRLGSQIDSFAYYTRATGRSAGGGRAFGRRAYPARMRGQTIPAKG